MSSSTRACYYVLARTALIVTVGLLATQRCGTGAASPAAMLEPDRSHLVVFGADHAQLTRLTEALERFRTNRLDLPDLEVRFSDDPTNCGGHPGGFRDNIIPWQVLICSDLDFVITHELAHAWSAANLDDAQRQRYLHARGLATWNDHTVRWDERGTEDAAFIIQQNLMIRHPRLDSPTWHERIAAYELLTGNSSPLRSPET